MKSITETARELILEKGNAISNDEIAIGINAKNFNKDELQAIIYSDLITDGQFFLENNEWNLKSNFTLKEVNKIRSQNIVDVMLYDDEQEELFEENSTVEEGKFEDEEDEIDVNEFIQGDSLEEMNLEDLDD